MTKAFAVAAAVGATGALALGSVAPADAATYYYAGGTHQAGQPSHTSENEWKAFLGADHVPPAHTVQYARDLWPLIGEETLDHSVAGGVTSALALIDEYDDGQTITLVGVSQGAVVMAETKQALIDAGFDPARLTVFTFGDPTNPDGGLLAKLDRWNVAIPGFTPVTHTPGEGAYVTVVIEYDVIADAPDTLNPFSWANALLGAAYDHPSYSQDLLEEAEADGRVVTNTDEWYQSHDDEQPQAYYQHVLIKQENLPVTRPLRDAGTAIADDQGDVVVNRIVDRIDNVLRPAVDAGYDGGEPGGFRHVGGVTKHYEDEDGTAVSAANRSLAGDSAGATAKRPIRDAVKKIRDSLKSKSDENRRRAAIRRADR